MVTFTSYISIIGLWGVTPNAKISLCCCCYSRGANKVESELFRQLFKCMILNESKTIGQIKILTLCPTFSHRSPPPLKNLQELWLPNHSPGSFPGRPPVMGLLFQVVLECRVLKDVLGHNNFKKHLSLRSTQSMVRTPLCNELHYQHSFQLYDG